ncbi:hypothetical protein FRB95_014866 [Tulasnella sp. JGI-2019a]|nr:hypothetical protein FRB95_014866 [Tulasnella sp. JGI-2019a]
MFKRSPAAFIPPVPPDVTSSSESSPVLRAQQLGPDPTGALGRPQLSHHPSGAPPGSPTAYGQYPGINEIQEYQDFQDMNMNMNMMMMQRWQQQQTRRPPQQQAATLRSPGPPGKDPMGGGGRGYYGGGGGGPAAAAQFAYAAAAASAPHGYGFSPYPQPSPFPYQAAGGFPFGAGMYGQPAGYASPYMTPLPSAGLLDPMGGMGGMGGGQVPRPAGMPPQMGGGPGMGALVPQGAPSLIGRPGAAQEVTITGKWLPGTEYGPALDHLVYTIVQPPVIELHPLLRPISESRDSADPFLVFDILFPPNTIHLSTEPPRKSWSKGRKDPATFPRLKLLRLVNQFVPWVIQVSTDSDAGITVSDVINAIHEHFRVNASQEDDWNSCDPGSQSEILMAYKWNRSTEMGAPGGIMPDALLRGDFLMERTMFAGMKIATPDLCEQKMQVKNFPATFELMLHTR